jgi:hypothetical protein
VQTWTNCVNNEGDFAENNLNFVKDVPIVHLNFILIVIMIPEHNLGSAFGYSLTSTHDSALPFRLNKFFSAKRERNIKTVSMERQK